MESYYVINNKLPNFFIKDYKNQSSHYQSQVQNAYQIWIKEKIISNLKRRKANYVFFELAKHLGQTGVHLEKVQKSDFTEWLNNNHPDFALDIIELLTYLREKVPGLAWTNLFPSEPSKGNQV